MADQCPRCGHELDLPPPQSSERKLVNKKKIAAERAATVRRWQEQRATRVKRIGRAGYVIVVDSGEVAIGADRSDDTQIAFS